MNLIRKAKPNPGHEALAKLEALGVIKAVVTQNVDGLHQRAGSRHVIELHGSIWRVKCSNPACTFRVSIGGPPKEVPPKCPSCGHYLRPDVVWFGEPLPQDAWGEAVSLAEASDTVLVVGTSGAVYPAAYIPLIVKERGGTVIEVNVAESSITPYADIFLKGKAGEVLPKLLEVVTKLIQGVNLP
jgi:NAD-dependent deacetylase